jgi:catechol 2,3-dioxygenase-like lactoylglutathione lyase family enzyme
MLDHITLSVVDLPRSLHFYSMALAPLCIAPRVQLGAEHSGVDAYAGFGRTDGRPFFWIGTGAHHSGPVHIAFVAQTRAQVDAFYLAALAAGGRDNGGPGVRAHYDPGYYGAFVLDPDGHNIEAVCRAGE